ncbi:carboxypeptidase-like regulatory domain-containing protein [Nocardioides sp.]|uniref:carboxypeptidase-like regulatory domain-containing protein n=1 Tax=Nocardioides sp. TaxID=35761 RepID=UPI002D10AFD7|nr:carboxypeptidase-like regulatory domain-containing protein [Nocardioides sp.]HXH77256.1 carboxypeptidase-like regulatory domain-containing protein [Nocardioides sp.]
MSERVVRRLTAMGAGAALVAAGLSLGAVAPANAASVVTGGVIDGFGNPISGEVGYYRQQGDGTYGPEPSGFIYVGNDGYIEGSLSDGIYKIEFETYGDYTEFYKDQPDLATASAFEVAGGNPVALGSWTIDQPYVVGAVTNAAGKPLSASIGVFDAASGASLDTAGTDEQGTFKIATRSAPVKLSFSAEDHALEFYADAPDLASAAPVTATPTGANLGNIVLASGGSISGQVTSDAGVPLEFVEVYAGSRSDLTDKNGIYTIRNVRTGQQVVEFSDPIDEYTSEYYNNAATPALATPVSVGVGQAVGGINAALTPRPADTRTTEITGTVKDNLGVPVVGARVGAVTTPARTSDKETIEVVYSNRQGVFAFKELEKVQGENQFKIVSEVYDQGDDNAFALFGSWYGGVQDYDRSPAVTVTPGTPVGAVDVVLERAGGIAGSVTGLPGVPLRPQVSLRGNDDGALVNSFADFEADSTFETRSVRAGTYKVRFDDSSGFHAGEWWKDKSEVDDAVVITVKSGQLVTGLAAVLGNRLTAVERPSLGVDYPWVGSAITADPGVWNVQSLTDFDYEWLVGSTVVGTGETFTPTAAHIGDRLTLRVTAENRKLIGSATSATSVKIGYKPRIKVKTSGGEAAITIKASPVKAKKVKGKVIVKEIVKVMDNGTIKYKKIAKTKIKKGKGTVSLAKLKKGKHKLVFFFIGKGKVGSNDEPVKVKIKR